MTPSASVHTSIDDLPIDVLEYIYSFLPLETLPSVASASKRLCMGVTAKVRADLLMKDCISSHFCADHVLRLPQMYCLLALRIVGGGILVDLAGHPGELPEEMLGYTRPPFEVVTSALHQVVTYVDLTDVPLRAQVCDCLTQCFVRACEQGDLDIVKFIVEELKYDPTTYRSTGLITAARHNRVEVYKYLHADGRSDPSLQTNMAIGDACSMGYLEMARLLLQDDRVDPGFMRNYPLWRASKNGHTDVVRLLLGSDKVNPGDDKSVALRVACEEGHIEIVRMMLALPHTRFVDPGIENGFCLRKAIDNRHSEVVRMLLQDMRVDPSADHNSALQIACERNDPAIVQLLLNNPAVDPTMDNSNCLVLASKAGNLAAVLVLLADGRVNANARAGFALKAANSRKHKEVARLLKAYMRGGTAAVSDNITKARQSFSGESMTHRFDSVVPVSARASCPQEKRRTSEEELVDRRGSTLAYFSDLIMGKRKATESGSVGSSRANTGRRPTKSAAV